MYQVSVKEMAQVCGSKELMLEAYKQATQKLIGRVFNTTLQTEIYYRQHLLLLRYTRKVPA